MTKAPIEETPKIFSHKFCENKRNKNRSGMTKLRAFSRIADDHRKHAVSTQNIYTTLPLTIEEVQKKGKTELEDAKVTS